MNDEDLLAECMQIYAVISTPGLSGIRFTVIDILRYSWPKYQTN